uniref:Fibroblast growth factor n=2 Tax=Canis lupus familiaris TaxID=9615 RepID=A0A8C0SNT0_CANLF
MISRSTAPRPRARAQLPGPECSSPSPRAAPRARVQFPEPECSSSARAHSPAPSAAPRPRVQLPEPECSSPAPSAAPRAQLPGPAPSSRLARQGSWRGELQDRARLGARGRCRALPGGRLEGRGHGRAPDRVGPGPGAAAAPRAALGARTPRQSPPGVGHGSREHHHAARPAGAFPPGHFKDPKRLYCKNGGFFLRMHPEGRVDGVGEKSDPHVKLQLQVEERGVVSVRGVCANRYPATKEDGRLLASQCVTDECFFFERLKCSSRYVALERTGQYKLGPKTGPGQNAIPFLPMSAKS